MPDEETHSEETLLRDAIASVPAGGWAVGVSGGADSTALLVHSAARADLRLHVVHLDHQARGEASAADAAFVAEFASGCHLPCTIARLDEIEPSLPSPPKNLSARYRAARLELFRRVVAEHRLDGVLLAHHAGDQAETVLHRLLRGSGPAGLGGIRAVSSVGGLVIRHPLLRVDPALLRRVLNRRGIAWREDASNSSSKYFRNRLRKVLRRSAPLRDALLVLGEASATLRDWADAHSPRLEDSFSAPVLADLPGILAARAAGRWLRERGSPLDDLTPHSVSRLIDMARDAASPPRQYFPAGLLVRRRRGVIFAASAAG